MMSMAGITLGRSRCILALLLALFLLQTLHPAYLNYDGINLLFGSDGQLSVFSCTPQRCYPGFANLTGPPQQISSARPVNDSFVEFAVLREAGAPRSCALQLVALEPVVGQGSSEGQAIFKTGSFTFALFQAGDADAFSVEINLTRLCLVMSENSSKIHFFLVPNMTVNQTSNETQTANETAPSNVPASPASPTPTPYPSASTPNYTSKPAPTPTLQTTPAFSASNKPLSADSSLSMPQFSLVPSTPYLVLTCLFLAILVVAGMYIHPGLRYFILTLPPLLVGFYYLPLDGFRTVGLVLWGLLWLGFFLRLVFRKD